MELTTLTIGPKQRLILESILEQALDVWFDRSDDGEDLTSDIKTIVELCDKLDVNVPKEVRKYLAKAK